MKTTQAMRDEYRKAFGLPSDFKSMEYLLLEDADSAAALEALARELIKELTEVRNCGHWHSGETRICDDCRRIDAVLARAASILRSAK